MVPRRILEPLKENIHVVNHGLYDSYALTKLNNAVYTKHVCVPNVIISAQVCRYYWNRSFCIIYIKP